MSQKDYLDESFAILQERLGTATHLGLSASEAFASDDPVGVSGPLRTLTLQVQDTPFALLGLTVPEVSVNSAGLINYLARRARARRISYMVACNLRDACLLPVPSRPDEVPQPIKRYPCLYQITPQPKGSLSTGTQCLGRAIRQDRQ